MFSCSCGMIQAWSSFSDVWFIAFWCCTSRGKDEVQEFTWDVTRSKIYWIITCANSYLQTSFNYLPQINWPLIMLDCHIRKCWELPFWGLKWNFNPGFHWGTKHRNGSSETLASRLERDEPWFQVGPPGMIQPDDWDVKDLGSSGRFL